MDFEKSLNSFEMKKKDRLPDYLLKIFFLTTLVIFREYYHTK